MRLARSARRLDPDVLAGRALLLVVLAAYIGGVYALVVFGFGEPGGAGPGPGPSIVATTLVAITFEPVRRRARRLANRLLYGERATPYDVLSQFSARVAGTYAADEALPAMARMVAAGTGAEHADVWLAVDSGMLLAASWPPAPERGPARVPRAGDGLPALPAADRVVPVRHRGDLLGAIAIAKRPGVPVTPAEEKLLGDVAAQAGLVLRNVGLTAELAARLEETTRLTAELAASRRRIVAAQDAERRRIERDIHDGAQQHLVATAVKLRLVRAAAEHDRRRASEMINELGEMNQAALADLRELGRGIYPPALAEGGPAEALRTQVGRAGLEVEVAAGRLQRHDPAVEAAVYFACMEALQNATKHAGAARVALRLDEDEEAGAVIFTVTDDGAGFDPDRTPAGAGLQNMRDRVAALGGSLEVRSAPGAGTTVAARIPAGVRRGTG